MENQILSCVQTQQLSWLNIICDISMVLIAIANIILLIYTFCQNRRQEDNNSEKSRRIKLFETLVLDYNMKNLYSFFEEISQITKKLAEKSITEEEKQNIDKDIQDACGQMRQQFIDLLLAINKETLYDSILECADNLQGKLSEIIYDGGYNLCNKPKFDELITANISKTRTEMIKILFSYKGD